MGPIRQMLLDNSSIGSRFQPLGFLVSIDGAAVDVRSLWQEPLLAARGYGSYVWRMTGGSLRKIFMAVYFIDEQWYCMVDGEIYSFEECVIAWRKNDWALLGVGKAELRIIRRGNPVNVITYVRPWLRYWCEDGWNTQDEIDIGAEVFFYFNNAEVRERMRPYLIQRALEAVLS